MGVVIIVMCIQVTSDASLFARNRQSKLLKAALSSDASAVQKERYFVVRIPLPTDHNHHYMGPVSFHCILYIVCYCIRILLSTRLSDFFAIACDNRFANVLSRLLFYVFFAVSQVLPHC